MGFNVIGMTIESYEGLMVHKHKINMHVFNVQIESFKWSC